MTYKTYTGGAVLVTGTSSGIGRCCGADGPLRSLAGVQQPATLSAARAGKDAAVALAKLGFDVYATVRKERDVLELQKLGLAKLHPIIMDVTKSDEIDAAVATLAATGLPLVAVVNNAGISSRAPLEAYSMDRVRQTFDVGGRCGAGRRSAARFSLTNPSRKPAGERLWPH